ncbi:Sulfotransferase domain superfamily [Synechococcus sp. PCC 7335]|uniref:sulfotransferase domain-containing protein n=1 Tax=Synechococcus sp. (strain ATCC 29403 / PCC 7335) TaxID=91464 RepID=UPI00017ED27C|nr:sulfotransferase domain-containing protein [Synechococcus sp. PCC 7335]EDX85405.1 Sulfotransferase domain superfamily [Synechococcus sp. PCC 7335]
MNSSAAAHLTNHSDQPIVVTEFPKSGGSWISSMLGEVLSLPNRDIYVQPGFDLFDIASHPWYSQADALDIPPQCVVKSHELPHSSLINFDATYIHLIRDGRDVAVSKWFFDQKFCVDNGIRTALPTNFYEYVIKTAAEWSSYVNSWLQQSVITVRYEDFLAAPVQSLGNLLAQMGYEERPLVTLEACVAKFSKKNFSASFDKTFKHNTFVRKGIAGDWVNHFNHHHVDGFKSVANDTLLLLEYESTSAWSI